MIYTNKEWLRVIREHERRMKKVRLAVLAKYNKEKRKAHIASLYGLKTKNQDKQKPRKEKKSNPPVLTLSQKAELNRKLRAEKKNARQRESRKANPERYRQYGKRYRQANPEKVKASAKLTAKRNPEKLRATKKRWEQNNPEKMRLKNARQNHPGLPEEFLGVIILINMINEEIRRQTNPTKRKRKI